VSREHVHAHWYYNRPEGMSETQEEMSQLILDPIILLQKGRPKEDQRPKKGASLCGTRRLPLAFEIESLPPPSSAPLVLQTTQP
jgi:hypothetical protein